VGQVVESRHPQFAAGELVHGMFGWQDYALTDGASRVPAGTRPELVLSALGGTGLTAYFGMIDVGRPKAGDTVLVSGAAGATGSVAGQIARIQGATRVVGIAGGARKCDWLTGELGFDAAIDYKSENVGRRIRETCPDAIDVFFDNVGGEILDAALLNMKIGGRIALCGGISAYNETSLPPGPRNYMQLVIRRCTMQGFLLFDYFDRAREALADLTKWIADGRVVSAEDIQEGFENTPKTFLRLFDGSNLGKQLLRVAEPPLG
jgi:NADPH-dependent curcumin reductase CurA